MSESVCRQCGAEAARATCAACGAALHAGAYKILRVLAQGAHGRVYLAEGPDGSRAALKELVFARVVSARDLEAFEREAHILRSIDDPLIPRFTASFQHGEGVGTRLYLAQEFVEGENLEQRLASHRFSAEEVRDIAINVLATLAVLHGRTPKILHRDIKPANLILRPDGEISLVDFGSVRETESATTFRSTLVGTFGYMPFEQAGGTADETSDLYALGATLIHLLARQPPHELLRDGIRLELPSTINAPRSLRRLVERLVEPERAKRFAGANQALIALHRDEREPSKRRAIVAGALLASIASVLAIVRRAPSVPAPTLPAHIRPHTPDGSQLGSLQSRIRFGVSADPAQAPAWLKPYVESWIASSTALAVDALHPDRIGGLTGLSVVPAVFDQAVVIAGPNEYRPPGILSDPSPQGTLALWLRFEPTEGSSKTVSLLSSLEGGIRLNVADGRLQLFAGDDLIDARAPSRGEFHHLAVGWGPRLELFVDGAQVASKPMTRTGAQVKGLRFGGGGIEPIALPFSIDDVRLYSGNLTAADVRSLAEEGKGLTTPALRCRHRPAPVKGQLVFEQNFSSKVAGTGSTSGSSHGTMQVVAANDDCALVMRWHYGEENKPGVPRIQTASLSAQEMEVKESEESANLLFDVPLQVAVPVGSRLWLVYDVLVSDSAERREWWRQPAGVLATGGRIGGNLQQLTIKHGVRPAKGGKKIVFAQVPAGEWVRDQAFDLTDLFEKDGQGRLGELNALRLEGQGRDFETSFANVRLVLERL